MRAREVEALRLLASMARERASVRRKIGETTAEDRTGALGPEARLALVLRLQQITDLLSPSEWREIEEQLTRAGLRAPVL